MTYRDIPLNVALAVLESFALMLGAQWRIECSDHSLDVELSIPDKDDRAWDPDHYRNGNLFVAGYANPIKPRVVHNDELETPDTIDVEESDVVGDEDSNEDVRDGPHMSLISSSRYRDYMRQDLVSQLLTPQEQWQLLAYGILFVGAIQFVTIIVVLYATGSF